MIDFECPECGEPLSVPKSLVGEILQCPICGTGTIVPSPDLEPLDVEAIRAELKHPNPSVRIKAVKTLAKYGDENREVLAMLTHRFRDLDRDVRSAVMTALLSIGKPEIASMVVKELGGHWSSEVLLREAVFEMVKFGTEACEPLLRIIEETNHNLRQYEPSAVLATVIILGELGYEPAIPMLAKMFRRHFDLHVRDEAAYAMAMIGRPDEWRAIQRLPGGEKRTKARNLAKEVMAQRNVVA